MEENVDTECLRSGQLTEHFQQIGSSDLLFDIPSIYMSTRLPVCLFRVAGGEVLTNADRNVQGINDKCTDAIIDGGKSAGNPKYFLVPPIGDDLLFV
jgi:hypothetical protein